MLQQSLQQQVKPEFGTGQLTPEQAQELIEVIKSNVPPEVSPQLIDAVENWARHHQLPAAELRPAAPTPSGDMRYVPGAGTLEGDWRPVERLGQQAVEPRLAGQGMPVKPIDLAERLAPGKAVDPQTVRQWVKGALPRLRAMGVPDAEIGEMLRYLVVLLGMGGAGGAAAGRLFFDDGMEGAAA